MGILTLIGREDDVRKSKTPPSRNERGKGWGTLQESRRAAIGILNPQDFKRGRSRVNESSLQVWLDSPSYPAPDQQYRRPSQQ